MARSLWKGTIAFGLVSIPVELFPAENRSEFKLSMLDKRDFSPVGYKRYSKQSGKEIEWNNIVKGYEYEKGQYVVLSDEDFRRANIKRSRTIEIQSFVSQTEISPEFFDTPYYLVPADRAEKVYALLRETLRSTGRLAVAQFVLRTRQHLVAVKPAGRALMLYALRYADELRGTSGFELPAEGLKEANITAKEIDLAKKLIDDMTEKWNPAAFKDTYHEDLMARIQEKIRNGETRQITETSGEEAEPRASNVIDLVTLLKQSIDGETPRRASGPIRRPGRGSKPKPVAAARQTAKLAAKPAQKRKHAA